MTRGEADFVCGLLQDPVDHPFYLERYELTRSPDKSPFNAFLYASRNTGDAVLAYVGRTRIWKRDDDIEQTELAADALERSLVEDLDLSEEIVAQLAKHGALA